MRIISVGGLKGGVGKSILALNFAAAFRERGLKARLADGDEQGSLRDALGAGALDARRVLREAERPRQELERLAGGPAAQVLVLDLPSELSRPVRAALAASDLFLVPVLPGPFDVAALDRFLRLIEPARAESHVPGVVTAVANRVQRATLLGQQIDSALRMRLGVVVLRSQIGQRSVFPQGALLGQGVVEYHPRSPAADEVRAAAAEILELLHYGQETEA